VPISMHARKGCSAGCGGWPVSGEPGQALAGPSRGGGWHGATLSAPQRGALVLAGFPAPPRHVASHLSLLPGLLATPAAGTVKWGPREREPQGKPLFCHPMSWVGSRRGDCGGCWPTCCITAFNLLKKTSPVLQHSVHTEKLPVRQRLSCCVFPVNDIPNTGSYWSLDPRNIPYYPGYHLWSHLDAPTLPHFHKSLLAACALASGQSVALGFFLPLFSAHLKNMKYSSILQRHRDRDPATPPSRLRDSCSVCLCFPI